MEKWFWMCLFVVTSCAAPPTSPSPSVAGGSTNAITDVPAVQPAADDQVQVLNVHLQDYCSKGQIDKYLGADPWPITVTFFGQAPIILPRMQHDFTITLPYGPVHFDSVTSAGYRDDGPTGGNITIPFDDGRLIIEQRRRCEPQPVPPPPAPPPPSPPPPVPPPPVPPPPPPGPVCETSSSAGTPTALVTDPSQPFVGGVTVRGADEWVVEVHGRPDANSGSYYVVKTQRSYVTVCTDVKWLAIDYAWQAHPWHEFRIAAHNLSRSIDLVGQWVTKP